MPDIALSTDIIVGFPGETEADFEQTLAVVEQVGYDNAFVFRYSRRPGTPAADMAEQVPEPVKAERNARVLEVARAWRRGAEPPAARAHGGRAGGRRVAQERCRAVWTYALQSRRELRATGARVASATSSHVRVTDVLPHSLRGALATPEEAVCSSR